MPSGRVWCAGCGGIMALMDVGLIAGLALASKTARPRAGLGWLVAGGLVASRRGMGSTLGGGSSRARNGRCGIVVLDRIVCLRTRAHAVHSVHSARTRAPSLRAEQQPTAWPPGWEAMGSQPAISAAAIAGAMGGGAILSQRQVTARRPAARRTIDVVHTTQRACASAPVPVPDRLPDDPICLAV